MKIKILLRIILFFSLGALLWTAHQNGNMPAFDKLFPMASSKELQKDNNKLSKNSNSELKQFLLPQKFESLIDYLYQDRTDKFNVQFFSTLLNSQGIEHHVVKKIQRDPKISSHSEFNIFSGIANSNQKTSFKYAIFLKKTDDRSELLKFIFSVNSTQPASILEIIMEKLTSHNWIRNLENKQNIEFKNKQNKTIIISSVQGTSALETQILIDYQSQDSFPIQFAKLIPDSAFNKMEISF